MTPLGRRRDGKEQTAAPRRDISDVAYKWCAIEQYVAGDYEYNQIDVYAYSPYAMTYEYSFNNGISTNNDEFIGAAYNPRSNRITV